MSEEKIDQKELDEMPEKPVSTFSSQVLGESNLSFQANEPAGGVGQLGSPVMQSSPPPHSYRHSRAYRHFKNPPQPHMCIRTTTDTGDELFINVLSWTRIVIPQEPSDPIPLYGGMRVPPGSPRSPPIVFAVMANPEVLKDSGRHSKDPEERRAMIELMCDFVEAMNPGVKLVRNAIILKDRDISGELKDVWNAVQAQRDREREEQMLQQRQQQHYHNITTQQMFPKTAEQMQEETSSSSSSEQIEQNETSSSSTSSTSTSPQAPTQQVNDKVFHMEFTNSESTSATGHIGSINISSSNSSSSNGESSLECVDSADNESAIQYNHGVENGHESKETIEKLSAPDEHIDAKIICSALGAEVKKPVNNSQKLTSPSVDVEMTNNTSALPIKSSISSSLTTAVQTLANNTTHNHNAIQNQTSTAITTPTPTAPPKKEKLGGFLPNGCIFPRFKNNKHKDKDKEKESKSSSKDKEKTLLNVLKKSKDKKADQHHNHQQQKQQSDDSKTQYEKNCFNLESEVEKLDLNKIDSSTSNDNMFIKLKVAATSAAK